MEKNYILVKNVTNNFLHGSLECTFKIAYWRNNVFIRIHINKRYLLILTLNDKL